MYRHTKLNININQFKNHFASKWTNEMALQKDSFLLKEYTVVFLISLIRSFKSILKMAFYKINIMHLKKLKFEKTFKKSTDKLKLVKPV